MCVCSTNPPPLGPRQFFFMLSNILIPGCKDVESFFFSFLNVCQGFRWHRFVCLPVIRINCKVMNLFYRQEAGRGVAGGTRLTL